MALDWEKPWQKPKHQTTLTLNVPRFHSLRLILECQGSGLHLKYSEHNNSGLAQCMSWSQGSEPLRNPALKWCTTFPHGLEGSDLGFSSCTVPTHYCCVWVFQMKSRSWHSRMSLSEWNLGTLSVSVVWCLGFCRVFPIQCHQPSPTKVSPSFWTDSIIPRLCNHQPIPMSDPHPSTMIQTLLRDVWLSNYIVHSDAVGTPQLDLWG